MQQKTNARHLMNQWSLVTNRHIYNADKCVKKYQCIYLSCMYMYVVRFITVIVFQKLLS